MQNEVEARKDAAVPSRRELWVELEVPERVDDESLELQLQENFSSLMAGEPHGGWLASALRRYVPRLNAFTRGGTSR